ncbi:tetratricopeptide repeat protein [Mesorhizobium sp. J18]|uniref:tetratricopeptide repeat protein n=1 Tax=Mesorhizobium sp. J18 TaxID=935263 RepID=UPI00119BCC06|nr:tetratricopeptide repeat protein [Mesorhizobium sp. J18]TWG89617.1 tetratricopeptide repeat protein [Mesorhizobium sp. J18]
MRRIRARLLATVGMAVALALTAGAGLAKEEAAKPVATSSFSGAFLAARSAELENDLDNAVTFYERALSYDPDNRDLQQSLLLGLISNGSFDKALPYAEKLKTVPEVERFSRLALAVDAFRKEDYAKVQDWLNIVLESDLDRLINGVMAAWAKVGAENADAGLKHLDSLNGPDWYALFTGYHRALMAAVGGKHEEAVKEFDAVLNNVAAGGAAPETYMRAAEAYAGYLAGGGDKDGALKVLDKAEEFITGRASTVLLRERIESGNRVDAIVGNPAQGASEILLNVATALNRGGGESFVRLYLQYALALRPANDEILTQLGSVAEQQNQPEAAIAFYEKVPEASPLRRIAELQIGLNLADLDRKEEAISHIKAALEEDPNDMRAYIALGSVYASQENYRAAAEVYEQAVKRLEEPTREHWNIFYQRGIAYERLKEWPKAEPNFHKALELYPNQPQVLNYLGYSWVDMGIHLEEGLELIKTAVELRPSDGYIVDSLGWAYYRLGQYEDAVRELERAVSLKPGDPVLNDHLGDAYWRVGRRLEATFQWSHARDLDPEPDLLASVSKKLEEGLPPEEDVKVAQAPAAAKDAVRDTADTPKEPVDDAEEPADAAGDKPQETEDKAKGAEASVKDAAQPASYIVKPGQTLWSIAVERFGDGNRYRDILELNPQLRTSPDSLHPGQELRLPQ